MPLTRKEQTELYNEYAPKMRRYIKSYGTTEETEEIVNDAMFKVLTKYDTLKNKNVLNSWIMTTTKRAAIDYIRAKRDPGFTELKEFHEKLDTNTIDKKLQNQEHINILTKLLTQREKEVIELYIEGYKHKDISKKLQITIGTSKFTVHSAQQRINTHIKIHKWLHPNT